MIVSVNEFGLFSNFKTVTEMFENRLRLWINTLSLLPNAYVPNRPEAGRRRICCSNLNSPTKHCRLRYA